MITDSMTPSTDANLIWLVKVNLDGQTLYFSDADGGITLSTIQFSGAVLHKESWDSASLDKSIDLRNGGGIGSVGSFIFSIVRYNPYTGTSDFFNDFYPATSQEYLSSRTIDIGYVWNTAETTGDITWVEQFFIYDYRYDHNKIELTCLEISELSGKTLPYYKVQDDYDNGISYFTKAVDIDKTIPFVYGDFTPTQSSTYLASVILKEDSPITYAPALIIDKTDAKFLVASHPCESLGNVDPNSDYYAFRFVDSIDRYMRISVSVASSTSGINTEAGHYFTLQGNNVSKLLGELCIKLVTIGGNSDISNVDNIIDIDVTNYNNIDAGEKVTLYTEGSVSRTEIGELNSAAGAVVTTFSISSNNAGSRGYKIGFYFDKDGSLTLASTNKTGTVTGTTPTVVEHEFGATNAVYDPDTETTTKSPYDISSLCSREYYLENTEAGAGDEIRVLYGWLVLSDINVLAIQRIQKSFTANLAKNRL